MLVYVCLLVFMCVLNNELTQRRIAKVANVAVASFHVPLKEWSPTHSSMLLIILGKLQWQLAGNKIRTESIKLLRLRLKALGK